MNNYFLSVSYLISTILLISNAVPISHSSSSNLTEFSGGINILKEYAPRVVSAYRILDTSMCSVSCVLTETCQLLSHYHFLQNTLGSYPALSNLLNTTLFHGCMHVKEQLGVNPTLEPLANDSCYDLSYLQAVCEESVLQDISYTVKNMFVRCYRHIRQQECSWLERNEALEEVRDLYRIPCDE